MNKLMGAEDIIEKPVQKKVLLEKVKKVLSEYE